MLLKIHHSYQLFGLLRAYVVIIAKIEKLSAWAECKTVYPVNV